MKKKLFATTALLMFVFILNAQDAYTTKEKTDLTKTSSVQNDAKNEIRLNLLESVIGLPEINYERFIGDNFGLGAFAAFSLDKPEDSNLRSMFLIYGRLYLGNTKPCSGFYIEGNTGLVLQKTINDYNGYYSSYGNGGYYVSYYSESEIQAGLGLGVATGYKFLTKNNWVGEFSLGLGRIYGGKISGMYPRVGITIGKRF